jgi:hypothetical protein
MVNSIRLDGLDPNNSDALSRAIMVQGAWLGPRRLIYGDKGKGTV